VYKIYSRIFKRRCHLYYLNAYGKTILTYIVERHSLRLWTEVDLLVYGLKEGCWEIGKAFSDSLKEGNLLSEKFLLLLIIIIILYIITTDVVSYTDN
jgi:hypothetical protein